ncbi:MAG: hypothetical protein ACJ77K_09930 [Bacteroidia bacterium]
MQDNKEIHVAEVSEILSAPPKWIFRWGTTVIISVVLLLISLFFLIKQPTSVSAKVIATTGSTGDPKIAIEILVPMRILNKIKLNQEITIKLEKNIQPGKNEVIGVIKKIPAKPINGVCFVEVSLPADTAGLFNISYSGEVIGSADIVTGYVGFLLRYYSKD